MLLRVIFSLLFCLALGSTSSAQVDIKGPETKPLTDTLQHHLDSLTRVASVSRFTDSLKINAWSDSLRRQVNFKYSTAQLNRRVDSLLRAGVPAAKIIAYKDSLSQKGKSLLSEISTRQGDLQQKVSSRYDNWLTSARKKYNLDSMNVKAPALPSAALPGIPNQPNVNMPQIPGLATSPFPALNSADFTGLPFSPDLKQVAGNYAIPSDSQLKSMDAQLPGMNDLVEPYAGQVSEVKNSLKDPGKAAEEQVGQLAAAQGITNQADAMNQLKNNEAM